MSTTKGPRPQPPRIVEGDCRVVPRVEPVAGGGGCDEPARASSPAAAAVALSPAELGAIARGALASPARRPQPADCEPPSLFSYRLAEREEEMELLLAEMRGGQIPRGIGGASRLELAAELGIKPARVSNLLRELLVRLVARGGIASLKGLIDLSEKHPRKPRKMAP